MEFTRQELFSLAARAVFLKERQQGVTIPVETQGQEERYALWVKKAGGSGGTRFFHRRLQADGINPEQAKILSSEMRWNEKYELPTWTKELNNILQLLPTTKEELENKLLYYFGTNNSTAKNDRSTERVIWILPFLYYAEQRLLKVINQRIPLFSKEGLSDISKILAKELLNICHKLLAFNLKTFVSREKKTNTYINHSDHDLISEFTKKLLAGTWKDILLEYPVLARLIIITINNWVNNFIQLANNLSKDIRALQKEFNNDKKLGKVTKVEGNIGDSHNQGKSVLILGFASNEKIVYKPRNLSVDISFYKLVHLLKDKGFKYDISVPKTLNYHCYGWVEYIKFEPLASHAEALTYYQQCGALLALIYALGGNDFHGENLIASGKHPVLIDFETILSNKVKSFRFDNPNIKNSDQAEDIIRSSVLLSGFLPFWLNTTEDQCFDFGALTANIRNNIPMLDKRPLKVRDFLDELLEGFRYTYSFLMINSQCLLQGNQMVDIFKGHVLRYILRNTKIYSQMLSHILSPEFLKDGFIYSIEIERFAPAFLIKVSDENVKKVWPIFLVERDALEERDIPIFFGDTDSCQLRNVREALTNQLFVQSPLTRVSNRITSLKKGDQDIQCDFIKESLSLYQKSCHENIVEASPLKLQLINSMPPNNNELLQEARSICDAIMARAVHEPKKSSWIVPNYNLRTKKIQINSIDYDLYDGFLGISLFMSALYKLTSDESIKSNVISITEEFRNDLKDQLYPYPIHRIPLGLGNGLAGIIKALLMIGDYMQVDSFHEDVVFLISKIKKELIKQNRLLDIATGSAGLIVALLEASERLDCAAALELAYLSGQEIVDKLLAYEFIYKMPIGFTCGTSGIIYALLKLYSLTNNQRFYETAQIALADENRRLEQSINTSDVNLQESMLCSGVPGLGLSRAGMLPILQDNQTLNQLKIAIDYTLNNPLTLNDQLCCGNSGRIDFLVEAAQRINQTELLAEAKRRLGWMLQRKERCNHYFIDCADSKAVVNPSLFQGLAGIGYVLLRCINPRDIRSIFV